MKKIKLTKEKEEKKEKNVSEKLDYIIKLLEDKNNGKIL